MPLKKSVGNMYPWVTHTHSHLGGECPHRCTYCYVNNPRFGRPARYTGDLRLIEGEFGVKYGEGRIIFIENCNDLFAEAVPGTFISRVLAHCRAYPKNQYVIQTKNPIRVIDFIDFMPGRVLIGTTIESNRHLAAMGQAPAPRSRVDAMVRISGSLSRQTFVTVEPILDFDAPILAHWIAEIQPEFVNIGADSKGHGLIEPSAATIREFLKALDGYGIPVREKHNLGRLLV